MSEQHAASTQIIAITKAHSYQYQCPQLFRFSENTGFTNDLDTHREEEQTSLIFDGILSPQYTMQNVA